MRVWNHCIPLNTIDFASQTQRVVAIPKEKRCSRVPYPEGTLAGGGFSSQNRCRLLTVFASGGLNLSFKSLGGHKNWYPELKILTSCRHGCPKFWFASKVGGRTRVLAWSFCCTTLIVFANGGLKLSLTAVAKTFESSVFLTKKTDPTRRSLCPAAAFLVQISAGFSLFLPSEAYYCRSNR